MPDIEIFTLMELRPAMLMAASPLLSPYFLPSIDPFAFSLQELLPLLFSALVADAEPAFMPPIFADALPFSFLRFLAFRHSCLLRWFSDTPFRHTHAAFV